MGRLIGYARVSTTEQDLQLQLDALNKAGCVKVFEDKVSGARSKRPGLDACVTALTPRDTLVRCSRNANSRGVASSMRSAVRSRRCVRAGNPPYLYLALPEKWLLGHPGAIFWGRKAAEGRKPGCGKEKTQDNEVRARPVPGLQEVLDIMDGKLEPDGSSSERHLGTLPVCAAFLLRKWWPGRGLDVGI